MQSQFDIHMQLVLPHKGHSAIFGILTIWDLKESLSEVTLSIAKIQLSQLKIPNVLLMGVCYRNVKPHNYTV